MKQEDWTKRLRDRLADYEEPVPEDLWAGIEARLPKQAAAPVKPARTVPLWAKWAAAAAFLGIVGASGLLLWHDYDRPQAETPEPRHIPEEDIIPMKPEKTAIHRLVAAIAAEPAVRQAEAPVQQEQEDTLSQTAGEPAGASVIQEQTASEPMKPQVSGNTAENTVRELDRKIAMTKKSRKAQSVGFSLYASNGFGSQSYRSGVLMSPEMLDNYNYEGHVAGATRSGSPVYLSSHEEIHEYRQPISFGITANIPISSAISLSSGVVYTRLSSDFTSIANSLVYQKQQTLHYIGIPLSVQYRVWQWRGLGIYATAGGQADFNVKSRLETEGLQMDTEKDRPQWSVGGALGVQYDIIPQIGIYAEPGVRHYFDNGSSVKNFFKDKPTNFNLQVGLRLNLH